MPRNEGSVPVRDRNARLRNRLPRSSVAFAFGWLESSRGATACCAIIPPVAGGLEVTSGNRAFPRTFPLVNRIILESFRLFSKPRLGTVFGRIVAELDCSTSDYSFSTFPQVGRVVGQYRQLLQPRGGTAAAPPPVLCWYCGFRPFLGTGNNKSPGQCPGWYRGKRSIFLLSGSDERAHYPVKHVKLLRQTSIGGGVS